MSDDGNTSRPIETERPAGADGKGAGPPGTEPQVESETHAEVEQLQEEIRRLKLELADLKDWGDDLLNHNRPPV